MYLAFSPDRAYPRSPPPYTQTETFLRFCPSSPHSDRELSQVLPLLSTLILKCVLQLLDKGFEVSSFQRLPDMIVTVMVEWVQVEAQRAREQHWVLNDRERKGWSGSCGGGGERKVQFLNC